MGQIFWVTLLQRTWFVQASFFELVKLAEQANIVFSISEIYCLSFGFVLEATSNTTPSFVCKQHYSCVWFDSYSNCSVTAQKLAKANRQNKNCVLWIKRLFSKNTFTCSLFLWQLLNFGDFWISQ